MHNRTRNNTSTPTSFASLSQGFWRNFTWATSFPPYPGVPHLRGNPLTGRLPYLQAKDGLMHNISEAAKLAESSEKGMCSFWVENKLILLITNPELIYDFKMRFYSKVNVTLPYWENYPGYVLDRDAGLTSRKAYHSLVVNSEMLSNLETSVSASSLRYIQDLTQQDNPMIEDAGVYFRTFALEMGLKLLMGIENFDESKYSELLEYMTTLMIGPSLDSSLYLLGLREGPAQRYFAKAELQRVEKFRAQMQERFSNLLYNPHKKDIEGSNNLLHALWRVASDYNGEENVSPEVAFGVTFFVLIGGPIIGIGDSFPLALQLLNDNPNIREKLIKELRDNPTTRATELPYLDAVIKETYRLNPPVPIIPPRIVDEDFQFHGLQISKGESILVAPFINHRSPTAWENPNEFMPERFIGEDNLAKIPRGAYIPFGLGERDCIGKRYGLLLLKTFIADLYRNFDLQLSNNSSLQIVGATLAPTNKLQIKLTPANKENTNHLRPRNR